MVNLKAKFKLIDEMSSKFETIASSGKNTFEELSNSSKTMETAFEKATSSTESAVNAIESSKDSVVSFKTESEKASEAVEKLSSSNDKVEDSLKDVDEKAEKAKEKIKGFGEETEKSEEKSKKFGEGASEAIQAVEEMLVSVGIVQGVKEIGDVFVSTIEDAVAFESAITGVYKTVDGTSEQLRQIRDETKEMALVIPSTTDEIAEVEEAAGQLGIATENVTEFTGVMINLGNSTNLAAEEGASSLAKFANITGMSADKYENLGSTVVALGNNLATTEADIVAMSTRMASAAALAGFTESQILALSGSLSSVGVEADAGGSAMSTLISKIQLAVETGNEQLEYFASVSGHSVDEFRQKWGTDAVGALYDFIAGLNDTERNGKSATAILDEMGITEIRLSNAVKALAKNHDGLKTSLDIANTAWEENTALATEANTRYSTLESKLKMTKNAQTNLSTSIGEVFAPTVSSAAEAWGDFLNGMTNVVERHPGVVKGITAMTVTFSTFVVGVTTYTTAVKVAKIATTALDAAFSKSKVGLVITGVVALTAGIATLTATMGKAEDEAENLTASSRNQKRELEELNQQYNESVKLYGKSSTESKQLYADVVLLTDAYEKNKQTIEQHQENYDSLMETVSSTRDSFHSTTQSIDEEYYSTEALIEKLSLLGSSSTNVASKQALIEPIIDTLNTKYSILGITYSDVANNLDDTLLKIKAIADAEHSSEKTEAKYERLKEIWGLIPGIEAELSVAQINLSAIENDVVNNEKAISDHVFSLQYWKETILGVQSTYWALNDEKLRLADELKNEKTIVDSLSTELKTLHDEMKLLEDELGYTSDSLNDSTDTMISYSDAVKMAVDTATYSIDTLTTAYDEAYASAKESIEGQIGLFDVLSTEYEQTASDLESALDSQLEYLNLYIDNLQKAEEYGLDESLVSKLSDGSEESAQQLAAIIDHIEELGGTTQAAEEYIDNFNKKYQEVEMAKNTWSDNVAEMSVNFEENMNSIQTTMEDTIDNLNLDEEAKESAKSTIDAYVEEIVNGTDGAVAAATLARARVLEALGLEPEVESKTSTSNNSSAIGPFNNPFDWLKGNYPRNGYANGTEYATRGAHIVGENGPEIIDFEGGEKVYTASETARIISNGNRHITDVPDTFTGSNEATVSGAKSDRTVNININGSGNIKYDKSLKEEEVVEILANQLKPVLIGILQEEMFEEGVESYDY